MATIGTPSEPDVTRWRVVVLCALVCLLDGYDMVVAPVGTPAMAADWALAPALFATALAAAVLGTGLGSAFLAPLGDRYGRRPLVIWSFALVGAASLAVTLCTSVWQLTVLRFITGLGMGASLSNALTLTAENAAPRFRSRVLACVYASSALGGALGGLVAPYLLAAAGWQGVYLAGGVLPLLLVPVLWLWLAESPRFLAVRHGVGRGRPATVPSGLLDSLSGLLAVPYRRTTVLIWVLFFLGTFTTYMISSWLPTLMHLYGWAMNNAVRAVMTFSFGGIAGGFLLSWMVDRGWARWALLLGYGVAALALAGLRAVPTDIAVWMVFIALMGAGVIGAANALTAVAAMVYPTHLRAGGIGVAGALGRVGATLAPIAGGALLALNVPVLGILTALVAPMFVAFLVVLAGHSQLALPSAESRQGIP